MCVSCFYHIQTPMNDLKTILKSICFVSTLNLLLQVCCYSSTNLIFNLLYDLSRFIYFAEHVTHPKGLFLFDHNTDNLIGYHYETIQPMWSNLTQFKFNISGIFSRNKSVQREITVFEWWAHWWAAGRSSPGSQPQTEKEPLFWLKGHFNTQLLV